MFRGTTPNIQLKLNTSLDLNDVDKCYVSFKSKTNSKLLNVDIFNMVIDPEEKTISLTLSQEDTLGFGSGEIDVQIRLLMTNGFAYASTVKSITMKQILKDGVI